MNENRLWEALDAHMPAARELRRTLHRVPEVSGKEAGTRDTVLKHLDGVVDPESVIHLAGTGAVCRVGGSGPAVGLRAELDALPVVEETEASWRSENLGAMHACGHDVHMAALVAVMSAVRDAGAPWPALAVLQPREETYPSGAEDIADSGVLTDQQCGAMIGTHVQSTLDAGHVSCTPGGVNAAADEFHMTIRGTPGHAAYPHLTNDSLFAASQVVVGLQSVVSRLVDPMSPAVLGVSSFAAGEAANVVPGEATVSGTLRSLDERTRQQLRQKVCDIANGIAEVHGCTADVRITAGEPVLFNDPAVTESAHEVLVNRGFSVVEDMRSLGADDFAFYAESLPSLMLFVGTGTSESLHSSTFLPDDDDLRNVARAMMAGYIGAGGILSA